MCRYICKGHGSTSLHDSKKIKEGGSITVMVNNITATGLGAFHRGVINCAHFSHEKGIIARLIGQVLKNSFCKIRNSLQDVLSSSIILPEAHPVVPNHSSLVRDDQGYPHILLHSGRTDGSGGHRDLLNRSGLGAFHFHHTRPPHLPCCGGMMRGQAASIINPYTGRVIPLGRPYIFRNNAYFSVNLVARALTGRDNFGASLGLLPGFPIFPGFDSGGHFFACNRGESSSSREIGEQFNFTYPSIPILGTIRNNVIFHAEGNRGGQLELLCHTTQAELDPDICFAYVQLETIWSYMWKAGFFTGFSPNVANMWHFNHIAPLREIVSPLRNTQFYVGDVLRVRAAIQDPAFASLLINGRGIVSQVAGFNGREAGFIDYTLTDDDIGNATIAVDARNGFGQEVLIPSIRVNVDAIPEPSVRIMSPSNGAAVYVGESVTVSATVENANNTELLMGTHVQSIAHSLERQWINFSPYTFTEDDIGETVISATSSNTRGLSATDTIRMRVQRNPRSEFLIAIDPGHGWQRTGNTTPQMPGIHAGENDLILEWESRPNRRITPAARRRIREQIHDGIITLRPALGVVSPSGIAAFPAAGSAMLEREFNTVVSDMLIELLSADGFSVINVAPDSDPRIHTNADQGNGVPNSWRVDYANNTIANPFGRPANFYLSIHANAHAVNTDYPAGQNEVRNDAGVVEGNTAEWRGAFTSGDGIETFYNGEFELLQGATRINYGQIIQNHLMNNGYQQRNRRTEQTTAFEVVRRTTMPAALIEAGFMTNLREATLLMDTNYRQKTAYQLYRAICKIYDLWKDRR